MAANVVLEQMAGRKLIEMSGGPPETRTPDPLIKSASPSKPQPTRSQKLQAFQDFPFRLFCIRRKMDAPAHGQKTDKHPAARVIDNQTVHPNCLRCKPFLRPVRELSVSLPHSSHRFQGHRHPPGPGEGSHEVRPPEPGQASLSIGRPVLRPCRMPGVGGNWPLTVKHSPV